MKAFYFRENSGEKFLIPSDKIKDFDKLVSMMEKATEAKLYSLEDEFNLKYWGYKCEGELYDTKIYIES